MTEPDVEHARRAALSVIDYYGIDKAAEIDLESIAWGLGIDIREARLKNSEAQLIRKRVAGIIRIRPGEQHTARGRFSIAHEIGHWRLHPEQNQYWICTADQIHRYKGNAMEIEANAFSAELLMPTPLFRPHVHKGTFGFTLADHLAKTFSTSLQATTLRMVDETKEPAVVVLSDSDQVCWSKRNRSLLPGFEFHIPRGQRLHPDSKAWGASLDGDGSDESDATRWFPSIKDPYHFAVYEETRYLEAYDLALSLLVVHEE